MKPCNNDALSSHNDLLGSTLLITIEKMQIVRLAFGPYVECLKKTKPVK